MKIRIALNTDWMLKNKDNYESYPAAFLANEISKLAACKEVQKNTATEVVLVWEGEDPVNEVTAATLGILRLNGKDGVFSVEEGQAEEEAEEESEEADEEEADGSL